MGIDKSKLQNKDNFYFVSLSDLQTKSGTKIRTADGMNSLITAFNQSEESKQAMKPRMPLFVYYEEGAAAANAPAVSQ